MKTNVKTKTKDQVPPAEEVLLSEVRDGACDAGAGNPTCEPENAGAPDRGDLLAEVGRLSGVEAGGRLALDLVRVGADETAVVVFTREYLRVWLHFLDMEDLKGWAHCDRGEKGCLLCRAGKKADERLLLPVYLPASASVGVLLISTVLKPTALLPKLVPALKAERPLVAFVTRTGYNFAVHLKPFPQDAEADGVIAEFKAGVEGGEIDIAAAIPRHEDVTLEAVPEIARHLKLKGHTGG